VPRQDSLLLRILRGESDANIPFQPLRRLLYNLGFQERIRGSHHIFFRDDIEDILNLQPLGRNAKSYQVKQIRRVILRYGLGGQTNGK
jgi:predicted RNA binding protein YcfA (HicA-like mRNA interferase family)